MNLLLLKYLLQQPYLFLVSMAAYITEYFYLIKIVWSLYDQEHSDRHILTGDPMMIPSSCTTASYANMVTPL
jgi:hypothetical protein